VVEKGCFGVDSPGFEGLGQLGQWDKSYLPFRIKSQIEAVEEPDIGLLFDLFYEMDRAVGAAAAYTGGGFVGHQDDELIIKKGAKAFDGGAVGRPCLDEGLEERGGLRGLSGCEWAVALVDPDAGSGVEIGGEGGDMVHGAKLINRRGNQFGDIHDLDGVLFFFVFDAVGQHRIAKWAGGGNDPGARGEGFCASFEVHAGRSFFFFLEHLGAPGSAAQPFAAAASHFHQFGVQGGQNVPGSIVDPVGPADVATIMVGYPFTFKGAAFFQPDLSFIDQLLEKCGVMDDLVLSAQLGIFIAQDVEAMGAGRDDLCYAIVIERLDILVGHHLEEEFVSCPAYGVTGAHLLFSENSVADADLVEDSGKGAGDLLSALIDASGAADPEQDIRAFAICGEPGHRRYLHERIIFRKSKGKASNAAFRIVTLTAK
jgi:hypothetical protein